MSQKERGVLAIFSYLDVVTDALNKIKDREEFANHVCYAHTSYHELMHVAEKKWGPSQVRWFTLTGSLLGFATGYVMPLALDWDYPLVVGGKTAGIYSVPANVIFMFELFVLFGAIATILGMLWMGRLANPRATIHDPSLTDDKFAIFVPNALLDGPQAKLLKDLGADEVRTTGEA